jgi:Protein of unknown function (DUF2380)
LQAYFLPLHRCWILQITMMRSLAVLALFSLTSLAPVSAAEPPRLAVFDLEMVDTSLQDQTRGLRADDRDRLQRTSDQLRKELGESSKFQVVDISPVNAAAHQSNLQACGGCDMKLAQQLDADLEITGVVQKISNLILNIRLYLRDAHTGRLLAAVNADMRGDTDESWSRTTRYLVHERLLAPNYGAPQARQ